MLRNKAQIGLIALAVALVASALAGCGGSDGAASAKDGGSGTASEGLIGDCGSLRGAKPTDDPDNLYDSVIKPLGHKVAGAYEGYAGPLMQTPYRDFKPAAGPPWTVGYSDSFSGNAWRAAALAAAEANFAAAKRQGLVSGSLIVTDSNLKTEVQIQQMRSMIQRHVDLILSIPGSPTALDGVIKEAYEAGIPVLTLNAPVTSPYAINVEVNEWLYGARMAQGLAYMLGGKGDIMTVQGIAGTPGSTQIEAGGKAVFASCPEIKIVDNYVGSWNNAEAKTATLQALATHPGGLDGIWQQGSMEKGIIEALEQQGRSVPAVTMGNPDQAGIAYWQEHAADGYRGVASTSPSAAGADAMFRIGMRVLEGKGPKLNAFVGNPPLILDASEVAAASKALPGVEVQSFAEWENPKWTFDSAGVANPASGPDGKWLNDAVLDQLFRTPGSAFKGVAEAGQE